MNSFLDALRKMPWGQVQAYFFLTLVLIIPGLGYLYVNSSDLIAVTTIAQLIALILISVLHSLPFFFMGAIFVATWLERGRFWKEKDNFDFIGFSALEGILLFYFYFVFYKVMDHVYSYIGVPFKLDFSLYCFYLISFSIVLVQVAYLLVSRKFRKLMGEKSHS